MQEKIDDIKNIQQSLWEMYKDFLENKEPERYKVSSGAFVDDHRGPLKYFCRNLVSTWIPVIDGLAEDIRNNHDVKAKTDHIKYIQNTVWRMYEDFLLDHDMGKYNQKMGELARKYHDKGDRQLLSFCQNIAISWCPVINKFAEQFRGGDENE